MIIDKGNYKLSFQWDGQGRAASSPYGNISSGAINWVKEILWKK
jgi:hypothetical protein